MNEKSFKLSMVCHIILWICSLIYINYMDDYEILKLFKITVSGLISFGMLFLNWILFDLIEIIFKNPNVSISSESEYRGER